MTGLATLVRQRLHRDRWQLLTWVAGIALLAVFSTAAIAQSYGTTASRRSILSLTAANPAILVARGLPNGASEGSFTFFEIFTFLALMAGLMSTFLGVRHTRAEEETGRGELVAATPAGRTTPTVATLLHGMAAGVLVGLATAAGFAVSGLDPGGSLVAGAAVCLTGWAFLGLALVAAQLVRTSRAANGIAAAAVVAAYLLRGIGDTMSTPGRDALHHVAGWPSWLSPIGWGQQTGAFRQNALWPLLLDVGLLAACTAAVLAVQSRRDHGASLLPERAGRAQAPRWMRGSLGLAWRLQWPTIVAWCAGAAVTGLLAGSLTSLAQQASATDPDVLRALRRLVTASGQSVTELLVVAVFGIVGVLAAACAVQVVLRLRQEETGGTAEAVLATAVDRRRWLLDHVLIGVLAVVLVVVAAGVLAVVGLVASDAGAGLVRTTAGTALAQLPAALLYLAVVAALFVLLPRAVVVAGWALLLAGVVLGYFGGMIDVPAALRDLSPFAHTPVPGGGTGWAGGLWMLALALAAATLSVLRMRHRPLV